MDYGNGLLNGHYQFNTKYRKQEMCYKISNVLQDQSTCRGFFKKADKASLQSLAGQKISASADQEPQENRPVEAKKQAEMKKAGRRPKLEALAKKKAKAA